MQSAGSHTRGLDAVRVGEAGAGEAEGAGQGSRGGRLPVGSGRLLPRVGAGGAAAAGSVLPSETGCVKDKRLAMKGDVPGKFKLPKEFGKALPGLAPADVQAGPRGPPSHPPALSPAGHRGLGGAAPCPPVGTGLGGRPWPPGPEPSVAPCLACSLSSGASLRAVHPPLGKA